MNDTHGLIHFREIFICFETQSLQWEVGCDALGTCNLCRLGALGGPSWSAGTEWRLQWLERHPTVIKVGGVFTGSAIEHQDEMILFYTGFAKDRQVQFVSSSANGLTFNKSNGLKTTVNTWSLIAEYSTLLPCKQFGLDMRLSSFFPWTPLSCLSMLKISSWITYQTQENSWIDSKIVVGYWSRIIFLL